LKRRRGAGAESAKLRANSAVGHHHTQSTSDVLSSGKQAGLDPNSTIKSIQKEVQFYGSD